MERDASTGRGPRASSRSSRSSRASGTTVSKSSRWKPNERRGRSVEATTESTSVQRELAIDASPETVWEFLVDPEKATRWMGQNASFDARPGGMYRVEVIPGNTARGQFVELDPPR